MESLWLDPAFDEEPHWEPVGNCTVQYGLRLEPDRLVAYREDGEPVPAAEVRSTCPSCQPPPDQPHIMEVNGPDQPHIMEVNGPDQPHIMEVNGPDQPHIMEVNGPN